MHKDYIPFRGANIDNIRIHDLSECTYIQLEQNYRSTKTIVNAANSLIDKNEKQIRKTVFSVEKKREDLSKLLSVFTDSEEGFIVANNISDLRFTNNYSRIRILPFFIDQLQSRVMEDVPGAAVFVPDLWRFVVLSTKGNQGCNCLLLVGL